MFVYGLARRVRLHCGISTKECPLCTKCGRPIYSKKSNNIIVTPVAVKSEHCVYCNKWFTLVEFGAHLDKCEVKKTSLFTTVGVLASMRRPIVVLYQ